MRIPDRSEQYVKTAASTNDVRMKSLGTDKNGNHPTKNKIIAQTVK